MNEHGWKRYIYYGVTAFAVIAASILFFFCLFKLSEVRNGFRSLVNILMPIIYGAVLAYVLTPLYNKMRDGLYKVLGRWVKRPKQAYAISKALSSFVSVVFTIVVVVALGFMVVPQVIGSIMGIVDVLPRNIEKSQLWLEEVLKDAPQFEGTVLAAYEWASNTFQDWIKGDLLPNLELVLTSVYSGLIGAVILIKNMLIGLIVAVYLLNIKETVCAQLKKIIYGLFKVEVANEVVSRSRFIHRVFGGFIVGKLLDSLIIGFLCFPIMRLLKLDYSMLISVIIGVTNVIPFFGPFIGAIPSAIILLMVSPMQALKFIIFVLLLQQFDGNILGPKILGDSTGLSSFWVLFSILLFGGLFGFVGMIIGVPVFAVIFNGLSDWANHALRKKKLTTDTNVYRHLDYVDTANNRPVMRKNRLEQESEDAFWKKDESERDESKKEESKKEESKEDEFE